MTPRPEFSIVLALCGSACVIEPGVLEGDGAADEVGESDSTSEGGDEITDESSEAETADTTSEGGDELAECLRGSNPEGGTAPGDFPLASCLMTCDQGWGHGGPQLAIAWTLHFESADHHVPLVVAPRASDGVVVVSQHEDAIETRAISSEGVELFASILPLGATVETFDAGGGMIYLAYLASDDEANLTPTITALDEDGVSAWSTSLPQSVLSLAALPSGGVIVGSDEGSLTLLDAEGSPSWTMPSIRPISLEVSPAGRILAIGYDSGDEFEPISSLYSELGVFLEPIEFGQPIPESLDLHFLSERRVSAAGTRMGDSPGDGVAMVVDFDQPAAGWTREYNRALDSCDTEGGLVEQPTWDWFGAAVHLPDGTMLIAAAEAGPPAPGPDQGIQPRVLHVGTQGELLASDRGLWFGQGAAIGVDAQGSAYAALTIGNVGQTEAIHGFHLRKYQP
ncbi:hypothetical protein ACNOYE_29975 [Nannocystaceae bacterium ST9]